ncbi:1-deoxy-D-xylulose-5-phosphate synthase N-terminal domain-containing protein [Actinomadura sp. J1-007]|uniref:1-deoxy-D-xylulose-5-phosphate synthase N-terminal domain-containing protein n=1 Tax=Actinomadura sp. J1-007 TaxID=2661913 RepID=UPI0019D60FFC|nr:1-deoxy-D-xylulose-5-phosphate synthase N-terminal domain-containing protein [Actinomadura sp. J1-007]
MPTGEFDRVLGGITDRHERLRAFSALSRFNTLYMVMKAGSGHLGSSFSAADLVSRLLLDELADVDVLFSSKGHDAPGLYAALIGLGRLEEDLVHRLRRLGGLPGHPDVRTPHMPFNTGSLGMGISKAKGLVLANRMLGLHQRVFVLTGDGELQEGQNYEALGGAVNAGMGELTVIVDHNGIQSDTWVRDVNDLGDLEARFAGFGWAVLRCDGHDFDQIGTAFRQRAEQYAGRPAVIIADTVKGGGCPAFAATSMAPDEWRYRFHSGAPAPEVYERARDELLASADAVVTRNGLAALTPRRSDERPSAKATGPSLPDAYGRALVDVALRDERIVAMDADLVLDTGLVPFMERLPERFIECGIAEQDMVSMASGLAARGLVPFVHSFSCFLHARPNEHIYNNATEGRRVVYVGSLAGCCLPRRGTRTRPSGMCRPSGPCRAWSSSSRPARSRCARPSSTARPPPTASTCGWSARPCRPRSSRWTRTPPVRRRWRSDGGRSCARADPPSPSARVRSFSANSCSPPRPPT